MGYQYLDMWMLTKWIVNLLASFIQLKRNWNSILLWKWVFPQTAVV